MYLISLNQKKDATLISREHRKKTVTRSSHRSCSVKKGVLRNFAKFTGKHLCQSLFLIKLGLRPATLLKKRLWHRENLRETASVTLYMFYFEQQVF